VPIWSSDDIARIIISVGQSMGITPRGIVIGLATGLVETNLTVYANAKVPGSLSLPHDAVGSDGFSVGVQQQQVVLTDNGYWWGPVEVCQDPTSSTKLFFTRLARLDYNNTANSPGSYAQAVQGSAFPDRYDQRMGEAQALYDSLSGSTAPEASVSDPNRPAYNEFPIWSSSNQDRAGTKVDLFLLHTQEGGGGNSAAEDLANYLANPANQVSYHYTVSQASDGGVTVVDVVDTDQASWSVGDANDRSINLCFAGSSASWSRDQWLTQSNAIDVAAYIAVQDCKKYGIPLQFIGTGGVYDTSKAAGVADHRYVTDVLGWGTHTDVGVTFPKDLFLSSFLKYAALDNEQPAPPPPVIPPVTPPAPTPVGPADDQLTLRWNCLGGQTLVEAVAEIRDKLTGTNDRPKKGAL
jgi:hypothetical protein